MSMSLTWIAICASILMGVGALLIFVLAVRRGYFRNLEEAKYQVFWSDIEELVESANLSAQAQRAEAQCNGDQREDSQHEQA